MADESLLTPELLRELLIYDGDTGKLFWRHRDIKWFKTYRSFCSWNAKNAGKVALSAVGSEGYLKGTVLGIWVRAHRVAWAIHSGKWPKDQIDHINGEVQDNRLENLREANQEQNSRNQKLRKGSSVSKGVSFTPGNAKPYRARIRYSGKDHHLGCFFTEEEAADAYARAAVSHHREFARLK